jgi:hypothetical protein
MPRKHPVRQIVAALPVGLLTVARTLANADDANGGAPYGAPPPYGYR